MRMDRHSQEDAEFGVSLICLEGWDQGMGSPELQDHPVGSGISNPGYYRPYAKSLERAQANMGFEKRLQISLLGNSQKTAPALLWTGHHCCSRIQPSPGLGWVLPHGIGAGTSLPKCGGEASCKAHRNQHDASLDTRVMVRQLT